MNERIRELAEEAGWTGLYTTYNEPTGNSDWKMVKESLTVPVTMEQIERFVELVRADEREAMVVEAAKQGWSMKNEEPFEDAVKEIVAIRARGEK